MFLLFLSKVGQARQALLEANQRIYVLILPKQDMHNEVELIDSQN